MGSKGSSGEGKEAYRQRGYVSTEWTFWCGLCEHWEQEAVSATKRDAISGAKRHGWRLTKAAGWVYPKHTKEAARPA